MPLRPKPLSTLTSLLLSSLLVLSAFTAQALADTNDYDGDGVSADLEMADGTSIFDPDSKIERLAAEACDDWNGFLFNLAQILELRNNYSDEIRVEVMLRDFNGAVKSTQSFKILAMQQFDVIVNNLSGFAAGAYGKVCTKVTYGPPSAFQGGLVYYNLYSDFPTYKYAFVSPLVPARTGSQFVTYNTFFPTRDAAQLQNFAAGFIQISNEQAVTAAGELIFYNQVGAEIRRDNVIFGPNQRRDFAAHIIGPNRTGIIEFRPADQDAAFRVLQNRYYFDSSNGGGVIAAVSVPGKKGTGADVAAAFGTKLGPADRVAVLEISNTLAQPVSAASTVYDTAGSPVEPNVAPLEFAPHETKHIILSDLTDPGVYSVIIDGLTQGSLISHVFEYGFGDFSRLAFASGIPTSSGAMGTLTGSYNNYLGGCRLRLSNVQGIPVKVLLRMQRFDFYSLLDDVPLQLEPYGATEFDLCENEPVNGYGQLQVIPEEAGGITGTILRSSADGEGEFAIPLSESGSILNPG